MDKKPNLKTRQEKSEKTKFDNQIKILKKQFENIKSEQTCQQTLKRKLEKLSLKNKFHFKIKNCGMKWHINHYTVRDRR